MATLEQVEKLREKVDCTYEEATAALDACEGDLLDAIIYLEKRGKKSEANSGKYSTKDGAGSESHYEERSSTYTTYTNKSDGSFTESINSFFIWVGKIVRRGNSNYLDILNNEKVLVSIPVTIFALLLIFAFPFMLPAMIIGLFCGAKFQFRGKDFEGTRANEYSEKASDTVNKVKEDIKSGMSDDKKDENKDKE